MSGIRKAFVCLLALLVIAVVTFSAFMPVALAQARIEQSAYSGLRWRLIGPFRGGRVIVDPKNPNLVFGAALGHVYGANPDRGIYRTRDGGRTWEKVLFKNENVGAIDLAFDPQNSSIIYATLWNTRRPPWSIYPPSYGPGSGIFKSTDGGNTWQPLTNGIPTEGLGHIGLAVAPTNV